MSGRWTVTITPDSDSDDFEVSLDPTTECKATNAICVDDSPLSNAAAALLAADTTPRVTAEFSGAPDSHGRSNFTVNVTFSENVSIGYQAMRDSVFSVTGGDVGTHCRPQPGGRCHGDATGSDQLHGDRGHPHVRRRHARRSRLRGSARDRAAIGEHTTSANPDALHCGAQQRAWRE